jgi:hypothetical protein
MLKINLLPPYINQAGKIRSAWTALAALLILELVALTFWQWSNKSQESAQIASVTDKENRVITEVDKPKQEADAERNKIQPIKQKTDFINALLAYNRERPDLYERVASYIYREVWIQGMQAEQTTLTMPAQAKSISGAGRFLLFMQNSPDFQRVQISSVPGWPPGTAGVEAGGLSVGGGYGGSGGSTGVGPGGPPPGYGGPPSGGGTGSPYSPGGAGGGPPGYPGGGPPIFGGGGTGGGGEGPGLLSPATPGGDTGAIGTGGAPIPYFSSVDRPRPMPVYFPFTVTALLTKEIVRPTYLGAGAGTDSGAAGYGGGPGYGAPPGYGTGGAPPGYPGAGGSASPYSTGSASSGG